jgi:hypothetical protein
MIIMSRRCDLSGLPVSDDATFTTTTSGPCAQLVSQLSATRSRTAGVEANTQ